QRNKQKLTTEIDTTNAAERRQIAALIKQLWQAIGITVDINLNQRDTFFSTITARSKFSYTALLSWDQVPSTGIWLPLHSREIPTSENGYVGANIGTYNRKEADSLLFTIFRAIKPGVAEEAARSLMTLYSTDLPTLPLVFKPEVALVPTF